ncbi:hypothetical protein JCM10449v2_000676 [Rhodotorula kratochvilovae]
MSPYPAFLDAAHAVLAVFCTLGLSNEDLLRLEQWTEDLSRDEGPERWTRRSPGAQQTALGNLAAAKVLARRGELLSVGAILSDQPVDLTHDYQHLIVAQFEFQTPVQPPRWINQQPGPFDAGRTRFRVGQSGDVGEQQQQHAASAGRTSTRTHLTWQSVADLVHRVTAHLLRDADPSSRDAIESWVRDLLEDRLTRERWQSRHAEYREAVVRNLRRVEDWIRAGATELPDADWVAYATVPPVPAAPARGEASHTLQPADIVRAERGVASDSDSDDTDEPRTRRRRTHQHPPTMVLREQARPAFRVDPRASQPAAVPTAANEPLQGVLRPQRTRPRVYRAARHLELQQRGREASAAPASAAALLMRARPPLSHGQPSTGEPFVSAGREQPGMEHFVFVPPLAEEDWAALAALDMPPGTPYWPEQRDGPRQP